MSPFESDLDSYLRARFPLIVVVSREEERVLQTLRSLCENTNRSGLAWDLADGFSALSGNTTLPSAKDPAGALDQIDRLEGVALFVLKDFHDCWSAPLVKRKLRSVVQRLRSKRKCIIAISPHADLPEELKDEAVILVFPAPKALEIEQVLARLTQSPGVRVDLTPQGREHIIQAALGLTVSQAQRVFAKMLVKDGCLRDADVAAVLEEKRAVIRESEALEFYSPSEGLEDVGGLGRLKEWLLAREQAFSKEARDYGIPAPKGVALVGIPGTGKSLAAKMIGSYWRLPLLRLDVGALFGSYVGESEERARRALRVAETIAPCIVWIDELEKALGQGAGDGGTGTRVFGAILTWMQEKTAPCFVIATANDITKLPPELLRRGRFDEIFFLDLPNSEERAEIFQVHLRKRRRDPAAFDLTQVAADATGYVGAEIEQAIIDAMFAGFNESREFTTGDISSALKRQVPMSISARESIDMLRRLLTEGRAQSASFPEAAERTSSENLPVEAPPPGR